VARGVAVLDDSRAYVAAGAAGIAVVNLDDPAAPVVSRVERAPEGMMVGAVVVDGATLAAGTSDGVLLYDLADPLSPRLVGAYLRGAPVLQLAFAGDLLFVAADLAGLQVLDLTNRDRPEHVGDFAAPYAITGVAVGLEHAYAAGAGLLVLGGRTTTPTAIPSERPPTVEPTPTRDPHAEGRVRFLPFAWK
jgi:hypothetical protein